MTPEPRQPLEAALAAYRARVLAHRTALDRVEAPRTPGVDYWLRRAPNFRPGKMSAPEIGPLLDLTRRSDTVLDIGAGAGRYAVPLSGHVARVVAVEPSPAMRSQLAQAAAEAGARNIDIVALEWPAAHGEQVPACDVSLAANVLYGVADVAGFLLAMEAHTRRSCAVITSDRAPSTPLADVWRAVHGEVFEPLPALPELLAVLAAMGRRFDVRSFPRQAPEERPLEDALAQCRWMYRVEVGSPKEAVLRAILVERFTGPGAAVRMPAPRRYSSLVSWPPEAGDTTA